LVDLGLGGGDYEKIEVETDGLYFESETDPRNDMDDSETYQGIKELSQCITRNILFNTVFSDAMK
jgi:3-deoxy-D-manno-octulosonic acid (KDO) 8-phosphate synthase